MNPNTIGARLRAEASIPGRPPTARQLEVLVTFARLLRERGYPPTLREVGGVMGIRSTNGVHDHFWALESKGFMVLGEIGQSRSVRLTDAGRALVRDLDVAETASHTVEWLQRCPACDAPRVGAGACFACRMERVGRA